MGSERFPEENEYDQFLQMHGGSSNAFTDAEMTTYYFEVRPAYLRGALEVFAGFFTGPLLKETSIEREVEAVDNEFAELAEPPQPVVQGFPFGAGEVEPQHALRALQGFLEIRPHPGRVPSGLGLQGLKATPTGNKPEQKERREGQLAGLHHGINAADRHFVVEGMSGRAPRPVSAGPRGRPPHRI